jgi:hypothetical protein
MIENTQSKNKANTDTMKGNNTMKEKERIEKILNHINLLKAERKFIKY